MPNIGFGEILLILVLALVIFGPKRLPDMGRSIGRSMREFRRATSDLRNEIESDLDVEEPPRRRARSARARAGSTGGAARAEEKVAGATTTPEAEAQAPAGEADTPTEAPTSEADRKPSAGDPTPD
jgi:sec-independent protein translocase protein TatA